MALSLVRSIRSGDEDERRAAAAQVQTMLAMLGEEFVELLAPAIGRRRARALVTPDRGQSSNLSGLVIGITISAIIAVAVAIPVINDVVADSNASGTTKTILDLLDLFVGLLILVAIAAPLMRRT